MVEFQLRKTFSFCQLRAFRSLFSQTDPSIFYKPFVRCVSVKPKEPPEELFGKGSDRTKRRLYAWGFAKTGALGLIKIMGNRQRANYSKKPMRKIFKFSDKIVDVSCGLGYTLYAVDRPSGSRIYGSGLNSDSQIGFQCRRGPDNPLQIIYNTVPIQLPYPLKKDSKFIKVAAGRAHSYALTNDGMIYSFGNNNFGQCARPIIADEDNLRHKELWKVNVHPDEHVVNIICGQDHSLFLTKSGKVFSCGHGSDGQTGLGHYKIVASPNLIEGDIKGEKIVKLSSTGDSVLALNDNGDIFGWGNSEYMQIPTEDHCQQISVPKHLSRVQKLGKIIDIASSGSKSMVLTESKQVFVWGFGILGKGFNCKHSEEPTEIPLTLFGKTAFSPDTTVKSIDCGLETLAAITNTGDLYLWGKNRVGQLGLGHTDDQYYPLSVSIGARCIKVSCGVDHTMALCLPH